MENIRLAHGQLRLLHPGAEIPNDEIKGGHHEVVSTGHNRRPQCDERVGERGELETEDAVEQSCAELMLL